MSVLKYPYMEFSGALQQRTTTHIKKPNEVVDCGNVDFNKLLGAMVRRDGSQSSSLAMPVLPADKPVLGAFIARYPAGTEIWAANNVVGDTSSTLKRWTGPLATDWTNVQTGMLANAETNMMYDLEEMWVTQYRVSDDTLGTPFTVDSSHNLSTTRQLQFAPQARFFMEFNGAVYAANAQLAGVRYRDRLYKSSGPTGVISFARSAQSDTYAPVTLVDQVPTMTSNSAPVGTALASGEANALNQAYMAFDDNANNLGDKWTSNTTTGWLRYDFGSGVTKVITYYSVLASTAPTAPKNWTFEGSPDGSTWTVLDTRTNEVSWGSEKRTYSVSNTTAYRFYRINITLNNGDASYVSIGEFELLVSTSGTKDLILNLDSVRYIKPGMLLDIYQAGTNTKLFTITVATVDKANDTITFTPVTQQFVPGNVNTTTDVITVTSTALLPTGTPVKFNSTTGLPAPLVTDATYYVINLTGTTLKLATNLINAQTNVAIDLTTTGSGSHNLRLSYAVGNKDEFWGSGRKGKLTRYWNTDYRNPETSDWLKLPATLDGANDITGVGKISSRMFIFTENSMTKYDGQNFTPLKNDVGCISAKSICYYDTFMVWLDGKGQVWIRNEEAGESDIISIPIQKTLKNFTQDQLRASSGVCVGYMYKLMLGTDPITGKQLRVVYNFQSNQWTKEYFTPQMPVQFEYKYNGIVKPHFFDEHGQMWVDEQGNDDNGEVIPFDSTLGEDNFGADESKRYLGIKVYSDNCAGTKIIVYVDKGDPIDVGEITQPVQVILFDQNKVPKGTLLNVRFVNSSSGDPVQIEKATVYWNREEDTIRATPR